jgi:hypothetical protein
MSTSATTGQPATGWPKWRRRLAIFSAVVLAGALLLRVSVIFLLPPVMHRIASAYDMRLEYQRMELYMLGGDVGIWNLKLTPIESNNPVMVSGYCRAAISPWNLLRGRLVVRRLEADGVDLLVERDESGRFPLLERFVDPEAPPREASSAEAPLDLTPPLVMDAFRLHRVRARLMDRAVTPPFSTTLESNIRLSDVRGDGPFNLEVDLASSDLLDTLRLTLTGESRGANVDAKVEIRGRGIRLGPLAPYLRPMGIDPTGENLTLDATGQLKTQGAASTDASKPPTALAGTFRMDGARLGASGQDAIVVGPTTLQFDAVNLARAELASLVVESAGVFLSRDPDGVIRFAGVQLASGGTPPVPTVEPTTAPDRRPVAESKDPAPSFPWSLDRLQVLDTRVELTDRAEPAHAPVRFHAGTIALSNLSSRWLSQELPMQVEFHGTAPGVLEKLQLSGEMAAEGSDRVFRLQFSGTGATGAALDPYLREFGVRPALKDGQLAGTMRLRFRPEQESLRTDFSVENLRFTDGEELASLDRVDISGIDITPASSQIAVESITITGPRISARRTADGNLRLFGLETTPSTPHDTLPKAATASASTTETSRDVTKVRPIQIGSVKWTGMSIGFVDEQRPQDTPLRLTDVILEGRNLRFGVADQPPGTIQFSATMPGVAEHLQLAGRVLPSRDGIEFDVRANGAKLDLAPLAPYLQPMGLDPTLRSGDFSAQFSGKAAGTPDGVSLSLDLTDLMLKDGPRELLSANRISLQNLQIGQDINSGTILLDSPKLQLGRLETGELEIPGFRVVLPPAGSDQEPTAGAYSPLPLFIGELDVQGMRLEWSDRTMTPPHGVSATIDAHGGGLHLHREAPPGSFQVEIDAPGQLGKLRVDGVMLWNGSQQSLQATIQSQDLCWQGLAPYLPGSPRSELTDGQLRGTIDYRSHLKPGGGWATKLQLHDFDLRPANASTAMLHMDQLQVDIPHADAERIDVEAVRISGLEARATHDKPGTEFLGLRWGTASGPQATPSTAPSLPAPDSGPATTQPSDVGQLVTAARKPLPRFRLVDLELGFRRLEYLNAAAAGARPIAIADAKLMNLSPVELFGPVESPHPPVALEFSGSLEPLAGSFVLRSSSQPFADQPSLTADLSVNALRGQGLAEAFPSLRTRLSSPMTDGVLTARLEASGRVYRRGPFKIDWARGFDLDASIRDIAFRPAAGSPPVASLSEIRATGVRVEPAAGTVIAKSVEASNAMGRVWRDAEGLHVLGFILRPSPPQADLQASTEEPIVPAGSVVKAEPPPSGPGEIRIDRLNFSGLDFVFEDRSVSPPLVAPLNALDVEVRGLSTRAFSEERPIRFNLAAGSGKVELPERVKSQGVVGAVGDLAGLLSNQQVASTRGTEERELFSQATASGRLTLYPEPGGWIRGSVSGLELVALRGLAAASGIDLAGGVLDAAVWARFSGDGTADIRPRVTFTELRVSEPPDGPIVRHLALPAPLDVVLGVLEDPSGGITLAPPIRVEKGQLNKGALIGAAVGEVGKVIATAVASAPLKAAGGVGSLLGAETQPKTIEPLELVFGPGDSTASRTDLQRAINLLRGDGEMHVMLRHELGQDDLPLMASRANPTPAEARALADQLRRRKAELLSMRSSVANDTRAAIITLPDAKAADAVQRLRSIDTELGMIESSLDRLLDLLRPGADAQAGRRTRAASIELGQTRLLATRQILLNSGIEDAPARVQVTRATFNPSAGAGRVVLTFYRMPKK